MKYDLIERMVAATAGLAIIMSLAGSALPAKADDLADAKAAADQWFGWRPHDEAEFNAFYDRTLNAAKAANVTAKLRCAEKPCVNLWYWSGTLGDTKILDYPVDGVKWLCYRSISNPSYARCWSSKGAISVSNDADAKPLHYTTVSTGWSQGPDNAQPFVAAPAPKTDPPPAPAVEAIELTYALGMIHVAASVGGMPLTLAVDTGASESAIPTRIADQLIAKGEAIETASNKYVMADGTVREERRIIVKTMMLGAHTLNNVTVGVSPDGGMSLLGLPELGSMGRFSIDLAKRQLTLG
jgi:hypothetical protein